MQPLWERRYGASHSEFFRYGEHDRVGLELLLGLTVAREVDDDGAGGSGHGKRERRDCDTPRRARRIGIRSPV